MKKQSDYYSQIQAQEKKSSEVWRKQDAPASPEERMKNMWERVTNRVKTDKD